MLADIILAIGIISSKTTAHWILSIEAVDKWSIKLHLRWLWEYLVGGVEEEDFQEVGPIIAAICVSSTYVVAYFLGFWTLVFWVTIGVAIVVRSVMEDRYMAKIFIAAMEGDKEAQKELGDRSGIYFFDEDLSDEEIDKFLEEKERKK